MFAIAEDVIVAVVLWAEKSELQIPDRSINNLGSVILVLEEDAQVSSFQTGPHVLKVLFKSARVFQREVVYWLSFRIRSEPDRDGR